jgi:cephalosporin-C deacetylase-like acetyl esterase
MLPEKLPVEFLSEGTVVRADLYLPNGAGPHPAVVMGGGWCYVKELIQPEYARHFTEAGFACLVFDYRHLGESDGEPRQHIDPWKQIEDYRNAISYLESRADIDEGRIAAWGISYSGGHVFTLAALDSRVKVICSVVPMVNGYETVRRNMSNVRFNEFMALLREDRARRFKTGEHGRILHSAHPHDEISTWPSPETWPVFKKLKETTAPNHEHWSTVASAEWVLTYDIAPFLPRLVSTRALMVVASFDDIVASDLQVAYFNQVPTPTKRLVQLGNGASHMSIYDNLDHLALAAQACSAWLVEHL